MFLQDVDIDSYLKTLYFDYYGPREMNWNCPKI